MEKWFVKNKKADFENIIKIFNISELKAKLLINRDINTPRLIDSYLNESLEKLHKPELLMDMDRAVDIIIDKKNKGQKIRIVGDYDVDGVMSTVILKKAFDFLNIDSDYQIPNRVDDGYGINKDIISKAKEDEVGCIITCDNGISAIEEVKYSREIGLDIIVTDHHELPKIENENGLMEDFYVDANAIINPKRGDCKYPFDRLCGAGVCYKFVTRLYEKLGYDKEDIEEFIEYAAIATVCDVVDLVDENRIIVKEGLKLINNTNNIGLKELIEVSDLKDKDISVYHLGFIIGPSINASGRLDTAMNAIELFLTKDLDRAKTVAKDLKRLNDERKEMTEKGVERVINHIEVTNIKDDTVIVVYEPDIHESIAGIIAGRIKDRYNKPTIVLTNAKDGIKGSGRSIEDYNIFEELNMRKEYLNRFGGHPMAAGLSLDKDKIDDFRESLNKNNLTAEDLAARKYIDLILPIDRVSFSLIEELKTLEPYGKGNPKPLFGATGLSLTNGRVLGKNENVLKLTAMGEDNLPMEVMMFNGVEDFEAIIEDYYGRVELDKLYNGINNDIRLDILYYPSINEYMGRTTLQLILESYRIGR